MSVDELKKIAYYKPDTVIDDITDKWFVKCMSLVYLAQANHILGLDEAKVFGSQLEQDYKVLKLRQKIIIKEVAEKLSKELAEEKEIDFEKYPFCQSEWKKIGQIINKNFVQTEF